MAGSKRTIKVWLYGTFTLEIVPEGKFPKRVLLVAVSACSALPISSSAVSTSAAHENKNRHSNRMSCFIPRI